MIVWGSDTLAGIRTPAKKIYNIFLAWLVENKGNPKKTPQKRGTNSGEDTSAANGIGFSPSWPRHMCTTAKPTSQPCFAGPPGGESRSEAHL